VFLDELGELDPGIQVKLLRVIETRTFHPVGDTRPRKFSGKLIAATNRNLAAEIRKGRFREDLYFRLCSDLISTPGLREQIDETPGVLRELIRYMARRVAGEEADALCGEVEAWVESRLGRDYPWPGNYRELEQCVKNILIHRSYEPLARDAPEPEPYFSCGRVTAEELLGRYCSQVYAETGSYEETARRLGLDRRTVKAKVVGAGGSSYLLSSSR
jgi:DNA-binding NtrC family response regulator